ncbi:DUF354 domain-containing protein [Paludibacter sp. 221]|uniref:DUF354 domain-containing protein n=1 Tax=Paludibacter sp. 221 TaxID=2302939 RepID=UPI0013CF64FE|nr:DUF354 domain-containing protein [Paludibacter sp. 221]NDV46041.1 DUF354 domain-containing protein [Paludibacter sp. 221]
MNILIDIAHPAHVHLTKNVYFDLIKGGHDVTVTIKDIPSAIFLLQKYNIPFVFLGKMSDSLFRKAFMQLKYNFKLARLIRKKRIDIGFCSSLTVAQVSKMTKMDSLILDDDDDDIEPLFVKYGHSCADVVLSPDCVRRATPKAIFYAGYHELAYLHPKRFVPDPNVLKEIGIEEGETFFVVRFNAFKAHHDVGAQGLSLQNKEKLIRSLEKKGKVFITTERDIEPEFQKYQLKLSSEKIHSLLYYATMLIGDSQTMTTEAAVLGTPAIRCNSFAGRISVFEEEEHVYQLVYSFLPSEFDNVMKKVEEILSYSDIKGLWAERRQKFLLDKIDVTAFFTWFIENYPESKKIMQENPDYQYNFR